jgi:hypothetical protein
VRVADEGLATGGKPEAELTGAGSRPSADFLEASSSFPCFLGGRRVRFFDRGVVASPALRREVVGGSNRNIVATDGSRLSEE